MASHGPMVVQPQLLRVLAFAALHFTFPAIGHLHPEGLPGLRTYSTNPVCFPRFCVNPILPGLMEFGENVLDKNTNQSWQCQNSRDLWRIAGLCQRVVVGYHFAIPQGTVARGNENASEADLVHLQASRATAAYVAHLAGVGFDFWDYTEPWLADDCIQSLWKLVCYTYFPRCNRNAPSTYLRPCKNSCSTYLKKCQVSCCYDGISCVYAHLRKLDNGAALLDQGYADHEGPSSLCTGAVAMTRGLSKAAFLMAAVAWLVGRISTAEA